MNRKHILARFSVALALVFILGISALPAAPVQAKVNAITGVVEFAPPGSAAYSPLKVGQLLDVGSTIRTGSNGTADITTTPGSAIHLGSSSNLRLNALAFASNGNTVTQREAHLQLNSGVVSALIDPSTPKITDFQVQTPEGAAAARGTWYAVVVSGSKTFVCVNEGKVGTKAIPLSNY